MSQPVTISPGRRNAVSGALLGLGVAAFVDETVFHQLLHWHHFYDKSTPAAGLVSDGLFHAFGAFCAVASLFLYADLRRRDIFRPATWWGALLTGAGAFQLYDGTIQHKLLRLHQIRYQVPLAPYDWTWNLIAAALLITGATLLTRTRHHPRPADTAGPPTPRAAAGPPSSADAGGPPTSRAAAGPPGSRDAAGPPGARS